ncbi:unnamed protein product [Effrenium voratum]|uniref:PDZ domain-containing protein n=1 Tax=Effrenium voratum TaxID=2562239 RepID=A0AA36N2S6_9DINO|nr:unnamed protein product [Effrenium voratum]
MDGQGSVMAQGPERSDRPFPAPPGLSAQEASTHEAVREAVLRDIEAKVAEKMDEVWQKGQQMLAQVQKKQQEKTEQLTAQIVQCKEQQAALERENQALKQVLTDLAQKLMQLGKDSPGLSSAPTTASNTATPQRSDTGPEAEYSSTPLREVPPFPQPLQPPAPLLLSEALCSSSPMHLSLASTLQACGPMVFSMTLRKADGAELGLNVKPLDEVLLVEGVRPEGAVEAWNRQCASSAHPERVVLAGDRIRSVNNQTDPEKMLEECREKQLLKLTLVRGDGPVPEIPSKSLRADASEFVPKAPE